MDETRSEWRPLFRNRGDPFVNDKPYCNRRDMARDKASIQHNHRKSQAISDATRAMLDEKSNPTNAEDLVRRGAAMSSSMCSPRMAADWLGDSSVIRSVPGYQGFKPGYSDGAFAVGCNFAQTQVCMNDLKFSARSNRHGSPAATPHNSDVHMASPRVRQFTTP